MRNSKVALFVFELLLILCFPATLLFLQGITFFVELKSYLSWPNPDFTNRLLLNSLLLIGSSYSTAALFVTDITLLSNRKLKKVIFWGVGLAIGLLIASVYWMIIFTQATAQPYGLGLALMYAPTIVITIHFLIELRRMQTIKSS